MGVDFKVLGIQKILRSPFVVGLGFGFELGDVRGPSVDDSVVIGCDFVILERKIVILNLCHRCLSPASDLRLFISLDAGIYLITGFDIVTPGLMHGPNLLQVVVGDLEVVLVKIAVRLEAPSHGCVELGVVAFVLEFDQEKTDEGLNETSHNFQVL